FASSMVGGPCVGGLDGFLSFPSCPSPVAPVRSGLMISQCRPPSTVFITYCVPRKIVLLSIGENSSAGAHGSRYLRRLMSTPKFCCGQGVTSWLNEVRRLKRETPP